MSSDRHQGPQDVQAQPDAPAAPQLDALDKALLNELQFDFPLDSEPWDVLGQRCGVSGSEVLDRVKDLKQRRIVRQISPIFDTLALGYTSMLVAARVPEQRLAAAAAVVSAHPGVSHNYHREAEYNLWFTLAVPPGEQIEEHLDRLSREAGFESYRPLPTLRTFRIGVQLDMSDDASSADSARTPSQPTAGQGRERLSIQLTDFDKRAVRITQDDLPLVERPFDAMCNQLGIAFDELKQWLQRMADAGVLRRFAAILAHRSAGFLANGMVAWQVAPEHIEEAGQRAGQFPQVTHCYHRPAYPDWPYSLYTMIHARSREACQQIIDQVESQLAPLGVGEHRVLYSTHEYKKSRVRYFT
jgi:DNA-binding Lrp family transcriptional regulator